MLECNRLIFPVHLGQHCTYAVADLEHDTIMYFNSLWVCVIFYHIVIVVTHDHYASGAADNLAYSM